MIKKILLFVLYNDEVSINDSDKWVFPIKQTAKHKFVTLDDVIGIEQWIYIRLETGESSDWYLLMYQLCYSNNKFEKGKRKGIFHLIIRQVLSTTDYFTNLEKCVCKFACLEPY